MRYTQLICTALAALAALAACGAPDKPRTASQPTIAPAAPAMPATPARAPTSALASTLPAPTDTPIAASTRGPVLEPPPKCGTAVAAKPGQPQPTPALCPTATPDLAVGAATSGGIAVAGATTGPIAAQATAQAEFDASGTRLADPAQNLNLQVGETFRLKLGQGIDWTIAIADEKIISRPPGAPPADPAGPYQALAPGTTTIMVRGDPTCRKAKPACMQPSFAYEIQVAVR